MPLSDAFSEFTFFDEVSQAWCQTEMSKSPSSAGSYFYILLSPKKSLFADRGHNPCPLIQLCETHAARSDSQGCEFIIPSCWETRISIFISKLLQ